MEKPISSTPSLTMWFVMFGVAVSLCLTWFVQLRPTWLAVSLSMMVVFSFGVIGDRLSSRWSLPPREGNFSPKRFAERVLGFFASLAFCSFWVWILPEYSGKSYRQFLDAFFWWSAFLSVLSIPYFWFIDGRKEEEDGCLLAGRCLAGLHWDSRLKKYVLSLCLKMFFVPFMFSSAISDFGKLDFWFSKGEWGAERFFVVSYGLMYLVDVLIGVIGYAFSCRLFGTEMKDMDASPLSWTVTLLCYPPFWGVFGDRIFANANSSRWMDVFNGYPYSFVVAWGGCILALTVVYVMSTVSFGIRFSNLSNRGVVTSGTYAWMAHPAYVSKNLAWWMMAVPFIGYSTWENALKMSFLLLGINAIYAIRAKCEEKFLMKDEEYVAYRMWLSKNGLFHKMFGVSGKVRSSKKRKGIEK